MLGLMQATSFASVYSLLLIFCLCFFPTISLTNSITMQQVTDPGRDFPPIRTMGTLGWILINLVVGYLRIEASTTPFLLAAGICGLMSLYSLLALPHTPPRGRGQRVTVRSILGLDALAMMADKSFRVFVIASVFACIPLTFYYSFTNAFLNDVGVVNAAGKMTLGQISELGMLLLMPMIFRFLSIRHVLALGLAAWVARYVLLAYGNAGSVLSRHHPARRLLRLLLRERPALHRSGRAGASSQHGAGLHHLRDLRPRHAGRLVPVGERARQFQHDGRRRRHQGLADVLAQFRGHVVRHPVAGACLLPE
jgi:hypothetical protein